VKNICKNPFNVGLQGDEKPEHAHNLQTPVIGQTLRGGLRGCTFSSISVTNKNTLTAQFKIINCKFPSSMQLNFIVLSFLLSILKRYAPDI
jgi:hypothetical protein